MSEDSIPASMVKDIVENAVLSIMSVQNMGSADQPSLNSVMEKLALSIASLTAQNSGKTYIAPEDLAKRADAHRHLNDLLDEARAKNDVPEYELTDIVVFEDTLIMPVYVDAHRIQRPQRIGWWAAPNQAMRPVNEIARKIFDQFLLSIGLTAAPPAEKKTISMNGLRLLNGEQVKRDPTGFGAEMTDRPPVHTNLVLHGKNAGTSLEEHRILGTLAPPAVRQAA